MKLNNLNKKMNLEGKLIGILFLELIALSFILTSFSSFISGGVGNNVTVATSLQVGEVYPELLNVSIDSGASSVTLVGNSTKVVLCVGLIRDYNNDSTLGNATAEFFSTSGSSYGGSNDRNLHYTNSSCLINTSFGSWGGVSDDDYHALAQCNFQVYYYANPGNWNCTMFVNDSVGFSDLQNDSITMNQLLSIGLPASIDYSVVNSTAVSGEQTVNVSNTGNVILNLSLSGYAVTEEDNYSMNCTLGNIQNISINYEKFRLNTSITGPLTLSDFEANYTNLSSGPTVKRFNLNYRQDDANDDAINGTYWRVYVPRGVAGNCTGNILFGAVQAEE
ncbi:MAG TPA: hypothetical protein VJB35_06210 [Candidatus Nanoarchaeia archaeon]|nr:hypothetical protein [Candidatus Nanoarchaeia archaeon]